MYARDRLRPGIILFLTAAVLFAAAALGASADPQQLTAGVIAQDNSPGATSHAFLPVVDGYPPPHNTYLPTATPVPPGHYYPIPHGIDYEIVTIESAPDADLLTVMQKELNNQQSSQLAGRGERELYVLMGEECLSYVWREDLSDVLDQLFAAGSRPLIQGYFRTEGSAGLRVLSIIVAPWQGDVDFPQPTPDPIFPWCNKWPVKPANWLMVEYDHSGTWGWESWVPGDYESMVRERARHSTYYVIRPELPGEQP